MNLIESLDITSTNNLLIIINIVLIILAILLLVKLRKSIGKHEEDFEHGTNLKKENETDFTGIADIKPEEFNPGRFDLNKDFFMATTLKTAPIEKGNSAMQAPVTFSSDTVNTYADLPGTDELELEDELPEEFSLSQVENIEIPQPVKQEDKAKERLAVSSELNIMEPVKIDSIVPPEPEKTLPKTEEVKPEEKFEVTELEIPAIEIEGDKAEEEFVVPAEPLIPVPVKVEEKPMEKISALPELKLSTLDDKKKPEEEFVAPIEPEIPVPEKEEVKPKEKFVVPSEPVITIPVKAEEKPIEKISSPPELKLFSLDDKKKPEEEFVAPIEPEITVPEKEEVKSIEKSVVPSEPVITVPVKAEEKPIEKISAPPELKLFSLDDKKKPEEISASTSTELLTLEKAEEQKVKKASKRKSLF